MCDHCNNIDYANRLIYVEHAEAWLCSNCVNELIGQLVEEKEELELEFEFLGY